MRAERTVKAGRTDTPPVSIGEDGCGTSRQHTWQSPLPGLFDEASSPFRTLNGYALKAARENPARLRRATPWSARRANGSARNNAGEEVHRLTNASAWDGRRDRLTSPERGTQNATTARRGSSAMSATANGSQQGIRNEKSVGKNAATYGRVRRKPERWAAPSGPLNGSGK